MLSGSKDSVHFHKSFPSMLKMSSPLSPSRIKTTQLCHIIDALIVQRAPCDFVPFPFVVVVVVVLSSGIIDYNSDLVVLYSRS